jgi:hypothetical protein
MSIFALTASEVAKAGPFEDFFRAIRRAFREPQQKPRSHRSSYKQSNETASPDASSSPNSGGGVMSPPNSHNARTVSKASGGKSGLPYGKPVPGKKGFVTSPFSPDSGYIDVRGFPPGTPVKDPYTDKIFLTP